MEHSSSFNSDEWKNCDQLDRRDNLTDFVDGLVRTEVFPYPNGQRDIIPAVQVPVQEVKLKPGAYAQLTTWVYKDVWFKEDGEDKFGNMIITLTPEFGVGAFELGYHVRDEPGPKPANDKLPSVFKPHGSLKPGNEKWRMSLWARLEWVQEKIEYINWLRQEVADDELSAEERDPNQWHELADDSAADLEEEADPYDNCVRILIAHSLGLVA